MHANLSGPQDRVEPLEVGAETYLIREVQQALGEPLSVYFNSAVIRGAEPVIVDTGTARNREGWMADVFGLVEPEDVKWLFLTHDDADHTGNLRQAMEMCPNATLVCSWALVERFTNAYEFPLTRCRWLNDGQSFDAGDRTLVAVRPPVFDSPTTRGLFDAGTGVYWAVDSFATPVPGGPGVPPALHVAELGETAWQEGMVMFGYHAVSPWLSMVDGQKFDACLRRVRAHGMTTIIGAHTPVISGAEVDTAFAMMGRMVDAEVPPCPDQAVLEHIVSTLESPGQLARHAAEPTT
jgi:hypothetical protein